MTSAVSRNALVKLFGSAVITQGVLSVTNLLVGLTLYRRTSDLQYAYYSLLFTVLILVVALQAAFIQPQMVARMTGATDSARAQLVGSLFRDQRRSWMVVGLLVAIVVSALWVTHDLRPELLPRLNGDALLVILAGAFAILAALFREFFRMVLMAYRMPVEILRADVIYAAALLLGAYLATLTPYPAAAAALGFAAAACIGGWRLTHGLRRVAPWQSNAPRGVLRTFVASGSWTTAGSAIHWLFSRGFYFVVANALGVPAVAPLNATQTLIQPINLVSTGIGTMMLPTTSLLLETQSARSVYRRLLLVIAALVGIALGYFVLVWLGRDWLFAHVFKRNPPMRDQLMLMWFGIALLMLCRDQLIYLPLARGRVRILTTLTATSAATSLVVTYVGVRLIGITGGLLGVTVGEVISVIGLLALCVAEAARPSEPLNPA